MSQRIASLYAEIGADTSKFLAATNQVKNELGKVKGSFQGAFPGDELGKDFETYTKSVSASTEALGKTTAATKAERAEVLALAPGLERARRATTEFMGANAGLIAVVVGAGLALKKLYDIAGEGAQLQRLSDSGAEAARQLGGNMDLIVRKVKEASLGTVTDMRIIQSANTAMMLGLGADADQLAQLMEVAAYRGRVMGIDTTQAFDDIVRGLGRASPLILDNLGIIIDAKATYDDYAKSIGKSGNELTKAEKTQALLNKTLETGNKMIADAGGLADDDAAAFERLEASLGNTSDTMKQTVGVIGMELLPELNELASDVKDFTTDVADNWEEIKIWGYWITHIANPLLFLRDAINDGKDSANEYTDSLIDNKDALLELYGPRRHYTDAEIAAAIAAGETTAANKAQADGINNELIPSLYDLKSDLEAVEKAEKELSNTISDQIGLINNIQSAEEDYTKDSKKLAEQRGEAETRLAHLRSQGYLDQSEQVQDALTDLQDIKDAEADLEKERERQTLQFISNILAEKLARDGWTQDEFDAFADQQVAWGLWSADAVEKAKAAWMEADHVAASIAAIPSEKTSTINVITNQTTFKRFMDLTGGSPGRAAGGPVMSGTPYVVGEQGPELFVPNSSGNIIPNGKSGGSNFYINITADFADPETIARRLKPAVTRVMREAGVV